MGNSNIYKFTISRMGKTPPDSGEIYAADPSSLGGGEIIARFCRIDILDDDGYPDESFWADCTGRWEEDDPELILNAKPWAKKLRGYEHQDIGTIIWVGNEADYDIDADKWIGGLASQVNAEDANAFQLAGALLVSVQPYYNASVELDSTDDYGAAVEGEPSDEHNFSGVLLAPDATQLQASIDAAEDADELVKICEQWAADLPVIRSAYQKAKNKLAECTYVPTHSELIRVSLRAFGDFAEANAVIKSTEGLIEKGVFDEYGRGSAYLELASFHAGRETGFPIDRSEAERLLRAAAKHANCKDELEKVVELAGASYALDDKSLASELVNLVIDSTSDAKLKAKLKKIGKQALEDIV